MISIKNKKLHLVPLNKPLGYLEAYFFKFYLREYKINQ